MIISKRSKSPEASRVKKIDAKQRKEQISSAYGQKVIIPRKSKSQQSREERARKARDQERAKGITGVEIDFISRKIKKLKTMFSTAKNQTNQRVKLISNQ